MSVADDLFQKFVSRFPAVEGAETVPDSVVEEYRGRVPDALLGWWQQFGFSAFGDGYVWLCDPREWTPNAEFFIDAADQLPEGVDVDRLVCFLRSSFGEMVLWDQRFGPVLRIIPALGEVLIDDASTAVERDRDRTIAASFSSIRAGMDHRDAHDDSSLFEKALAEYGPLAHDQVYAFNPALLVAGDASRTVDHLSIQPAAAHLAYLSTLM